MAEMTIEESQSAAELLKYYHQQYGDPVSGVYGPLPASPSDVELAAFLVEEASKKEPTQTHLVKQWFDEPKNGLDKFIPFFIILAVLYFAFK